MMVCIQFTNGSRDSIDMPSYSEALDYCRHKISYTGGRIKRVDIYDAGSYRGMWDATWSDESNHAMFQYVI